MSPLEDVDSSVWADLLGGYAMAGEKSIGAIEEVVAAAECRNHCRSAATFV